jgi:hemerythrin superfamily protein
MVNEALQRIGFLFRSITRRQLDLLDQLEGDHIRVEMLFFRWRFAREEALRRRIFANIERELLEHSKLEEEVFYPACENLPQAETLMKEAYEEHSKVKHLLKELAGMPSHTSDRSVSKMKQLIRMVEHHVHDEENELFPLVRSYMKKSQLNKLGREFKAAKLKRSEKMAA